MSFISVSLWGAFMMGAIFYTQEARHPETRLLAAYLIFATVFTATAFAAFSTLTLALRAAGLTHVLEHPIAAAAFLAAVFLPAFFLARWQLRKPPRQHRLREQPGARKQI
jgi:hypothetical protein